MCKAAATFSSQALTNREMNRVSISTMIMRAFRQANAENHLTEFSKSVLPSAKATEVASKVT